MTELPDWTRGVVLLGHDGTTYRVLAVDTGGQLYVLTVGEDSSGNPRVVATDEAGQLIMVPRGQNGNYLTVDSSGYLTTVMKAAYGGTLKTLAAEDEGHLIALLKDADDQWGQKVSVGIGELAARLGSPVTWDRRGQLVQATTFEGGFNHCTKSTGGNGSTVTLDPTVWQFGGYSCKLHTVTNVAASALVTTFTDFSPSSRLGFEVAYSVASTPPYIYFYLTVCDESNDYLAQLRYNKAAAQIEYRNSAGGWTLVAAFGQIETPQVFRSIKGVVDIAAKKWVRILINGTEYDWSAHDLRYYSGVGNKYACLATGITGDDSATYDVYVDRMIITANEP